MVADDQIGDVSELRAQKSQLRRKMKRVRDDVLLDNPTTPSEQIAQHGLAFLNCTAGSIVSAYMAMPGELDPAALVKRLIATGMQIALPVVVAKGQPLIFRSWQPGDLMASGTWGIEEPRPDKTDVSPDIMLVPLLAYDAGGGRLGFGGGFYDRTIAALRAQGSVITVGLALQAQEVDAVPMGPHDENLDWILTPAGATRCGG